MEINKLSQIKSIEDFGNRGIHEVETLLRKLRQDEYDQIGNMDYPRKPVLPTTSPNYNQLLSYQRDFAEYERLKEKYDDLTERKRGIGSKQYQLLEEYLKEKSEFSVVPSIYRDKVWTMAWELGHSHGYGEVYGYLCDLVNIFKE